MPCIILIFIALLRYIIFPFIIFEGKTASQALTESYNRTKEYMTKIILIGLLLLLVLVVF